MSEELFFRAHAGLPRQAPGSESTTRTLLRLAGQLPENPRVLDIGSGPGSSSILLAQLTTGHVTAIDTHDPFLAELTERAKTADVSDSIATLNAPMEDIPLPDGCADLIWAEGSAYLMGFDAALASWRRLLADDGVIVLTEAEWLTPAPSTGAKTFWDEGYPAMRTTGENVTAAMQSGYEVRAVYVLPDDDWAQYYDPLTQRIAELRAAGVDEYFLSMLGQEISIRASHGHDYAYTGYVLRPRVASVA
ncbi:putative methyltransferase [Gordonia effusa NBRC 100432]|uniref:Putative methyltransferase n=1 Tax=Gordonia effusa NBRC 100432 TaxID=1077974 RepID=H0QWW6_9ACTN|nr:class I SAM-dependent methyltransferase [Gordonia effusa]GAB17317.1 putative methyltransferase [Gordonia effusa NBRC 100432]